MTKQEKIDNILKNFDFEKVHETMKFLKWTWYGDINEPSIYELVKAGEDKLIGAIKQLEKGDENLIYSTSSGGFRGTAWYYENELQLQLTFILTEWET